MSKANKVPVDIKKVDYVTDWDDNRQEIKKQIAPAGTNPEDVLPSVEYWEHWPQPVMNIIGRGPGGTRVHLVNDEFRPYFYVPQDEYSVELENQTEVTGIERGFVNPDGENMVRVYTRIPGDVPKLRDEYTHYEADILYPNRFLIDSDIEGSIEVPQEHANSVPTRITLDEIDDCEYNQKTRICFCDIEVYDKGGFPDESRAQREVTCITVYDNYKEEYIIFMYHPDLPELSHPEAEVKLYTSELDMLRSFTEYLNTRMFDMITGWNFKDFDMRYLVNRMELLSELEDDFELDEKDLSILKSAYDEGYFGAKVKGMAVFDMLRAYKNSKFSEADSYKLEDVAQEELGEGKITDNRRLYELWENDPQKLVDYNVKDVKLTVDLEEQQDIIKFFEQLTDYVGGRITECVDASKAVDIKILRAVNDKWAVPSSKSVEGEEFEGGEVFDPITGVRQNVVVLDLASLYPMSMKTLNAGPNTKDPDGTLTAPNGISFSEEREAVVVDIIDELLEERQKYKDLRDEQTSGSKMHEIYDRKQGAIKIVMNTLYGVLGWSRFRLYDEEVGAAVTATGRAVVEFTRDCVEDMGYDVIYGDTDSVMVELGPDVDVEEAKQIGWEVEQKINAAYDNFAKEEIGADEHWFDIEFEKLYKRYFQAGKKKRYAGHVVWKEGDEVDKTDTVGFETERSDYSKAAKDTLEETLSIITQGGTLDDLHEHMEQSISSLKDEELDLDYEGIPSSITKNFDDYENKTTSVRGAEYSNEALDDTIQPGDKPKKLFIKQVPTDSSGEPLYPEPPSDGDGRHFICVSSVAVIPDDFEIDWEPYIDKQIRAPHERVLKGTNWTWNEVLTGDRQPRLDEYEFEDRGANDNGNELELVTDEIPNEFSDIDDVEGDPDSLSEETKDILGMFEQREVNEVNEADMVENEEPKDLDAYL